MLRGIVQADDPALVIASLQAAIVSAAWSAPLSPPELPRSTLAGPVAPAEVDG